MEQFRPKYELWFWVVLGSVLIIDLVLGSILVGAGEIVGGLATYGAAVLSTLLLGLVIPRSYQLCPDRLRIILGGPLVFNIPFDTVDQIMLGASSEALAFRGLRFVTSFRTPVKISRSRGWDVVITPDKRLRFVEKAQQALANHRQGTGEESLE